jgi:photosynthetic reaction center cytochrome c subunit
MKALTAWGSAGLLVAAAFVLFVPTWTGVPPGASQVGFPQQIQFAAAEATLAANQAPAALPPAPAGGPMATAVYKNVQVLTDVSAAEFMRTQQAITQWVAPQQGCSFCHAGTDYASDAKATKIAARAMLRMTRHLNGDWASHVAPAGVTCFTCHRGQPVPAQIWFPDSAPPIHAFIGQQDNWQESADTVRKFFPDAGWAEYYLQDEPIAGQSTTALPNNTIGSFDEVKRIYEMMMQMSAGIGVNCGYCHNSRAFADWSQSTPYRWVGYAAIRLVRDLNNNFLLPLAQTIPQSRELAHATDLPVIPARQEGVQAGNGLVVCATCHNGLTQPLNGAAMLQAYPALAAAH